MHLFVNEYTCSGCSDELLDSSLRVEGMVMLNAIATDFARVTDCHVTTLWDNRHGPCPIDGVNVISAAGGDKATQLLHRLTAECDATFDIAPELDGILLERRRLVDNVGGKSLGPSAAAIELCSDKLRLANHCLTHGIPAVKTATAANESLRYDSFPLVLKRRDGAGSLGMRLVQNVAEWNSLRMELSAENSLDRMIVQPYVEGRHLSVAAIVGIDGAKIEIFPVGEQLLSDDGAFRYLGGRIPADTTDQESIVDLVRKTAATLPGLAGYVGFDILLPAGEQTEPILVEINPRLTTSYLGYRALTEENLAERLLFPNRNEEPIRWKNGSVEFTPAEVIRCPTFFS